MEDLDGISECWPFLVCKKKNTNSGGKCVTCMSEAKAPLSQISLISRKRKLSLQK